MTASEKQPASEQPQDTPAPDTQETESASVVPTAKIGDIVHYVLDNGTRPGVHRPAIVVDVLPDGRLDLQILTSNTRDFGPGQTGSAGTLWKTDVVQNEDAKAPNSWHHIEA